MSLNKAIASGKEHRKPHRKSKAFDYSCHNNGACKYCEGNRLHHHARAEPVDDDFAKPTGKAIRAWCIQDR